MRRSIENAAHVGQSTLISPPAVVSFTNLDPAGLFAPGGGQNPRHDQRRRRSQFDRGTRLAQIEEANGFLNGNIGGPVLFSGSQQLAMAPTFPVIAQGYPNHGGYPHGHHVMNGYGNGLTGPTAPPGFSVHAGRY